MHQHIKKIINKYINLLNKLESKNEQNLKDNS